MNTVPFESESFENFNYSWKARETYEFVNDDHVIEVFELAPAESGSGSLAATISSACAERVVAATGGT